VLSAGTTLGTPGTARGTTWENCIAEFVTSSSSANNGIGFDLAQQVGGTLIKCISKNNNIGILNEFNPVLPNTSVYRGRTGSCGSTDAITREFNFSANNIVMDNIISNNNVAGIQDNIPTGTAVNVYERNTVLNNGSSGIGNYLGPIFTSTAPIRLWNLPNLPNTKDNNGIVDPNDNMNITISIPVPLLGEEERAISTDNEVKEIEEKH